ncbi:MAG: phosphoglycerate kinase [Candidatus Colwellbacteria bacterium]|nr:phosphoglycerate kinase [Candidatus Colwellbacteria bacterium]
MPTYLLRLNLDIKERNFKDQLRFKLAAASVKSLSKKNNKVVILSHLGRPQAKNLSHSALTLKPFARALSQVAGKKIKFISHFNFPKIKDEIDRASGGSIFLLENLRFLPGENKNSPILAKQLAGLGNRYINDDFANSHRAHTSMNAITKFLPSSAGPLVKEEIRALQTIRSKSSRPFVLVIGGAKMADKIVLMKYLLPKVDYILVGGGPANNFLELKRVDIGSSIHEPKLTRTTRLLARNKKLIIPVDWKKERNKILDIGPETVKIYSKIIADAKTIIWNGPMGYFEDEKFAVGTEKIAKAILKNRRARIVIGGAETIASLQATTRINADLSARISADSDRRKSALFLSTGGGAMLAFLAGKKLPGIKTLHLR